MTEPQGQRGPKTNFRPKAQPPVSVTLTELGKSILKAASERLDMSQSDVIEYALRMHGGDLEPLIDAA